MQAGFCVGEMPVKQSFGGYTHIYDYIVLSLWGDTRHYENSENLFIAHCKARWTSLPIIFVAPERGKCQHLNRGELNVSNIKWLNLHNTPYYFPTGPCLAPPIHQQTSEDDSSTDPDEAESDAETSRTKNDTTDENLPIVEVENVEGDELYAVGPRMVENLIVEDDNEDDNNDDVCNVSCCGVYCL